MTHERSFTMPVVSMPFAGELGLIVGVGLPVPPTPAQTTIVKSKSNITNN